MLVYCELNQKKIHEKFSGQELVNIASLLNPQEKIENTHQKSVGKKKT